MKYIVEVKDVTKIINGKTLVKNVNLNVSENKIIGIVGRNGSGKTVLLKLISGLYLPTNGEIKIEGEVPNLDLPCTKVSALIDNGFLDNETGLNNIKILANLDKKISLSDIYQAFKYVDLDPSNKTHYCKYSTGMKQKLKLIQILLFDSKIIILDEPFNGLDIETVKLFRDTIISLKEKGKTILLTSHYPEDIKLLCDEVYEMTAGTMKMVQI